MENVASQPFRVKKRGEEWEGKGRVRKELSGVLNRGNRDGMKRAGKIVNGGLFIPSQDVAVIHIDFLIS